MPPKSPLERRQARVGAAGRSAEDRAAKRLGAHQVPGSGSGRMKGDMFTTDHHLECKTTQAKSFAIKLDWLRKIMEVARDHNRLPACLITFTTGDGRPKAGGKWVMIPEEAFYEIIRNEVIRQQASEATP